MLKETLGAIWEKVQQTLTSKITEIVENTQIKNEESYYLRFYCLRSNSMSSF